MIDCDSIAGGFGRGKWGCVGGLEFRASDGRIRDHADALHLRKPACATGLYLRAELLHEGLEEFGRSRLADAGCGLGAIAR